MPGILEISRPKILEILEISMPGILEISRPKIPVILEISQPARPPPGPAPYRSSKYVFC